MAPADGPGRHHGGVLAAFIDDSLAATRFRDGQLPDARLFR
jgi:hypothetical protein